MSTPNKPVLGKPTKQDINIRKQTIKRGAELWPVGTDTAKSTIYGRLKREGSGPGSYHWPLGLNDDYWSQLTAEKQVTRMLNGFPKRIWVKKDSDRNEALDCEVYAYAALQYLYTRHNRASFWEQMAKKIGKYLPVTVETPSETGENSVLSPHTIDAGGRISLSGWKRG
jgi:phage terminase large subunit GpA-like protein